ncbi:MAG: heavy metal translocating P-type ATPase [Phycisphaerales bacterium]
MSALAPSNLRASRAASAIEGMTPEQASRHRGVEASNGESSSAQPSTADRATSPSRASCTHCGLGVPAALIQPDAIEQFCCDACRLVYQTIHACGLDQYYAIRERLGAEGRRAAPSGTDAFAEFDDPAFTSVYARPAAIPGEHGAGLLRVELLLEGVHCAACLWLVERLPRVVDGVRSARLDFRRAVGEIVWDPTRVPLSRVARALASLGYRPHPVTDTAAREARRRQDRAYLVRIGVAAACAGNAMLLALALYSAEFDAMRPVYAAAFRWLSVGLGVLSLAWPGRVFLEGALASARARLWHLDMPIALALLVGNIAGVVAAIGGTSEIYADSLTMLVFLLLLGRWMQIRQQRHALDAVELLFSLTPGVAHVVDGEPMSQDAQVRDASVQSLQPGSVVEVRPQEAIPIDGVVVLGQSTVDASILTGESRPVATGAGGTVVAGAVNLASTIRVRATAVGRHTRAGRLMATIEELSRRRTPIVGSAQRLAAPFVLAVATLALVTLAIHIGDGLAPALRHAIALLVATCPCAIALATPLVVTMAVGRAAQNGVLVKGGDVFERLARPGLLVFDKTGTATTGRFDVLEWVGDASLRPLVAAIEAGSTHPVAVALARPAEAEAEADLDPAARLDADAWTFEHVLARGVVASDATRTIRVGSPAWLASLGVAASDWAERAIARARSHAHTPVAIAVDGRIESVAILGDRVRPDARAALDTLRGAGWRVAMLSGDDPAVVRAVASDLGIDAALAWGGASPEQKHERIAALVGEARRGTPVVMVGDGVNDAPALATASVGIAVRGGAEASLAAADVYVERGGLAPIGALADASRRVLRTIRLCLGLALAYNALAAGLALAGLLSPLVAAAMMPISSMTVLAVAVRSRTFAREWDSPATPDQPSTRPASARPEGTP